MICTAYSTGGESSTPYSLIGGPWASALQFTMLLNMLRSFASHAPVFASVLVVGTK